MSSIKEITSPSEAALVRKPESPITSEERRFFDLFFGTERKEKKVIYDWEARTLYTEEEDGPESEWRSIGDKRFHQLTGIPGKNNRDTAVGLMVNGAKVKMCGMEKVFKTQEALDDFTKGCIKVASENQEKYKPVFTGELTSAALN